MAQALNPKQLRFVELYLATGNATQSYVDAYDQPDRRAAEAGASRLLSNGKVCEAVEAARAKANDAIGITADWYAKRVKLEAEREGRDASHAARVSALRLAGDLLGVGELHKYQHSGPGGIPLAGLSDDELSSLETVLAKLTPELGVGPGGASPA